MGKYDDFISGSGASEEETSVPRFTVTPGSKYPEAQGGSAPPQPPQPAPLNKEFGELKPADPSWTQWLKWKTISGLNMAGMKPHNAQHAADAIEGLGSFTPMGGILAGADFTYNLPRGNFGAAAFDALGAYPGVRAARRVMREGLVPTTRTAATPSVDELERSSRAGYRFTENSPVVYHPDAVGDYATQARLYLESPRHGRGVFSPEKAPEVYRTLERWERQFPRGGTRPVTPTDLDTLRQQLTGLEGANGEAGRQAAQLLEAYMVRPPPRALRRGTPQDLDDMRQAFIQAKGDWRAAKTSEGVEDALHYAGIKTGRQHSGQNLGNVTRQELSQFVASPSGENRLFGASDAERQAIINAVMGDPTTNKLRFGGKLLGGGGGLGMTASGGAGAGVSGMVAHSMGLDPITSAGLALSGGALTPAAGYALNSMANERTVRAGREVAEMIARNSPLYRAREAVSPAVPNLMPAARDAMAIAIMQQGREHGTDYWNRQFVPFDQR
ncbi:hypothetical protein EHM76_04245 [bacterium]|nr:MAG: hypothetical protein EHM76_04245 [bacterium]